jgi:hypothetical protein
VAETYPSIGEAVAAAMRHNINLAHRTPGRTLPAPGTPARLTAAASRSEAAAFLEATARPLAQVTGLVAAAGDWARDRADVDDPAAPAYQVWQHLVAAAQRLGEARAEVEHVLRKIGSCPAEPRGAHSDSLPPPDQGPLGESSPQPDVPGSGPGEDRRRAARATSPHATGGPAGSPPLTPPAGTPPGPDSPGRSPTH